MNHLIICVLLFFVNCVITHASYVPFGIVLTTAIQIWPAATHSPDERRGRSSRHRLSSQRRKRRQRRQRERAEKSRDQPPRKETPRDEPPRGETPRDEPPRGETPRDELKPHDLAIVFETTTSSALNKMLSDIQGTTQSVLAGLGDKMTKAHTTDHPQSHGPASKGGPKDAVPGSQVSTPQQPDSEGPPGGSPMDAAPHQQGPPGSPSGRPADLDARAQDSMSERPGDMDLQPPGSTESARETDAAKKSGPGEPEESNPKGSPGDGKKPKAGETSGAPPVDGEKKMDETQDPKDGSTDQSPLSERDELSPDGGPNEENPHKESANGPTEECQDQGDAGGSDSGGEDSDKKNADKKEHPRRKRAPQNSARDAGDEPTEQGAESGAVTGSTESLPQK